jgi:ABC-2 type transport system ATP-binding protein
VDAIVAEDLRKRYKTVQALDGVSFSVRDGEVFGLLGPNGAGKSTTVRVLTTLTRADSGKATVAGEDVMRYPNRVRHLIGYIAQDSGVDAEATGRENLMLQGRIHGMSGAPLRKRVDELLELVGLADAAERVTRGYSGGMKRRLDIAIGLVHKPRVLFLDEPTTGLDPEARAGMWVEVERLAAQESLTILLTTHYLEEADRLAQRVAIVSRGKIVVEGTPEELKRDLEGESVSVELSESNGRIADAQRVVSQISDTVHVDGQVVRVRVPNGARAIPVILGALDDAGIDVAAVTTARPSLDDVYLHYTGRDFSREDAAG